MPAQSDRKMVSQGEMGGSSDDILRIRKMMAPKPPTKTISDTQSAFDVNGKENDGSCHTCVA